MNHTILPAPRILSEPEPKSPAQSDLAELALAARRQLWVVAFAGFLGLCLGAFHYATSPREYRATATVLIEERQSDLEQEIAATLPTLRSEASIMNQVQILGSLQLATEVADRLSLQENPDFNSPPRSLLGETIGGVKSWIKSLIPTPAPTAQTTGETTDPDISPALLNSASLLRQRTTFTRVGRSFVVEISHSSHDPGLATMIVNSYAEAYLADGIAANVEAADRMADWMEGRIEELRLEALAAANEAEAFRAEFGASDQQGLRERQERADALNELLVTLRSRSQEVALSSSFPASSGRLLSQALQPREPASPKAWQDLGAGLFLGLLLGLGFAVRRELGETGFRTGADVTQTLNLPFLGYMPHIVIRRVRSASPAAPVAAGPRVAFNPQAQLPGGMPTLMSRHSMRPQVKQNPHTTLVAPPHLMMSAVAPGSETDHALRRLHAAMERARQSPAGHVLSIAGLKRDDGATELAANLAHTAARGGHATLLIDGDFEGSGLSRALGATGAAGLVDVLDCVMPAGEAIRRITPTGLDILPTGLGPRQGGVIESSYIAEFGALVAELASVYETIVIDLPPLAHFPEAESLVAQLDHFILAVPWGRTPRAAIARFLQDRPALVAQTAGVVLTKTDSGRLSSYGEAALTRARPRFAKG